jgi:tRNA (guanine-N7-)-methyltransferase
MKFFFLSSSYNKYQRLPISVDELAMKKSHAIEREFGVPIPGKILEPARWARTALKKLPAEGPLDVVALFGRRAPLIVDLGCGNGRFLIGSALRRPEFDHIGIDILPMVLRYATRRGNQRGLGNLRFAAIDAQRFLASYISSAGVREIHCYHPQPHHHLQDAHKRLLRPGFLADVHRILEPGGTLFVQTDNAPYWDYLKGIVPEFFDFQEQAGPWPDMPKGRTRREILALRRRYPIYRGWGIKKEMPGEEASARANDLPLPIFDAGPRRKDLDQLEGEGS